VSLRTHRAALDRRGRWWRFAGGQPDLPAGAPRIRPAGAARLASWGRDYRGGRRLH